MVRLLRFLIAVALLFAVTSFAFQAAFPMPEVTGRADSRAIRADRGTTLGGAVLPFVAQISGTSGVAALQDGVTALAARLQLVDVVRSSARTQEYEGAVPH